MPAVKQMHSIQRTIPQSTCGAEIQNRGFRARHWSDWVGCLLFLTIAGDMLVRSPKLGLLLLPSALHELIVAASFLMRRPLTRQLSGWGPRIAAYGATFMIIAFLRLASSFKPGWIAPTQYQILDAFGFVTWLLGTTFGLYSMWYFRHAFSIVPQARVLVTSGPFRIARHPIYLSYVLQYLGIWLTHFTPAFFVVLVVWLAFTVKRISYEERIISAAFPEYAEYRSQVRALYPRFPRNVVIPNPGPATVRELTEIDRVA